MTNYNNMDRGELVSELKKHPLIDSYPVNCGLSGREYDGDLWVISPTVHGDYCGGYLQQANFQTLQDGHDWLNARHEGYGSAMLFFQEPHLVDASNEQLLSLLESLDSLTDYPVLDDELMYELERQAGDEAHEYWGSKDFREALVKLAEVNDVAEAEAIASMPDEQIDKIFWQTNDEHNGGEGYRQDGEGLTIYIDIDRMAKFAFEKYDLFAFA